MVFSFHRFDLLFPNNNESLLISEAKALGFKELLLVYDNLDLLKKASFDDQGLLVKKALFIKKPFNQKKDFFLIAPPERVFLDNKRVDFFFNIGLNSFSDHTHFRRSLTQVDVKLGLKRVFFFNLNLFSSFNNEVLLGRWLQDVKLFKKYGASFFVVSGASDPLSLRGFDDLKKFKEFLLIDHL